ncbi:hypothetical protein B0H15DRAFT_795834 [Mycena belliarum]|uniref:Uncharacterized protein n=1 Tax=Mycena belliarum TaxID=1033014 RepID=A0AAD6UG94_9AGAR|nr:hypothetical protein B0H15DRAFT_795834 [Mycena belliae]
MAQAGTGKCPVICLSFGLAVAAADSMPNRSATIEVEQPEFGYVHVVSVRSIGDSTRLELIGKSYKFKIFIPKDTPVRLWSSVERSKNISTRPAGLSNLDAGCGFSQADELVVRRVAAAAYPR